MALTKEQVLVAVDEVDGLPAYPEILEEIELEIAATDPSLGKIAKLIERDPALTASLLRIANSALFNTGVEVRNVVQAAMRLGLGEIRRVIIATALVNRYAKVGNLDMRRFWTHGLAVASVTQAIAKRSGNDDPEFQNAAFLAGLLHDIGAMALRFIYPEESAELSELLVTEGGFEAELQRERWGVDYCQVGARLAMKWRLPDETRAVIRYHMRPWEAAEQHQRLVQLVHLADFAVVQEGYGRGDEGFYPGFDSGAWDAAGLQIDEVPELIEAALSGGQRSEEMLSLALGGASKPATHNARAI